MAPLGAAASRLRIDLSFIFIPTFPLGGVVGAAALRLKIPRGQLQSQMP